MEDKKCECCGNEMKDLMGSQKYCQGCSLRSWELGKKIGSLKTINNKLRKKIEILKDEPL